MVNNIYKINDSKFKSIYVSFNYTINASQEDISKYAVLSSILAKSNSRLKTQIEIQKYLYSLYGVNFDINLELIGDIYNIEFRVECINKKFLPNNEDVVLKSIEFLHDIIYMPNMKDNLFDNQLVEKEKDAILNKIKIRKDEKLKYSVVRMENIMCKNEPFGASIYGLEEDVEKITSKDLSKIYDNLLNKSCITVILSGNITGYENINEKIEDIFKDKLNSVIGYKDLIINNSLRKNENKQVEEIYESQETTQSVLTLGLRISDFSLEDFYILNVYNSILGSNPSSKLFQNFREKESLAYTVRSRCYRFKDIIIIYAGIQKKNYDKAKQVIIDNINEISNGKISDLEFNAAKESLISDLLEWNDSKITLAKMIITNIISSKDPNSKVEDLIDGIEKVSIEDVLNFSKKVKLEKILLLGGEGDV